VNCEPDHRSQRTQNAGLWRLLLINADSILKKERTLIYARGNLLASETVLLMKSQFSRVNTLKDRRRLPTNFSISHKQKD
jgi:hypothetical protein